MAESKADFVRDCEMTKQEYCATSANSSYQQAVPNCQDTSYQSQTCNQTNSYNANYQQQPCEQPYETPYETHYDAPSTGQNFVTPPPSNAYDDDEAALQRAIQESTNMYQREQELDCMRVDRRPKVSRVVQAEIPVETLIESLFLALCPIV